MVSFRAPRIVRAAIAASILFLPFGAARGEGPVGAGSLPGGASVEDDDGGSGERWGRAGGRDLDFVITAPATFASLHWGAVDGTAPSTAFDGTVTPGTGEVMTFNPSESFLAGGIARWTGQANIQLVSPSGIFTLPTRFTLRVTSGTGPVPLSFVSGGVSPESTFSPPAPSPPTCCSRPFI